MHQRKIDVTTDAKSKADKKTFTMMFLAVLGGLTLAFFAYALAKLLFAFYSHCDAATAITPTLKPNAFADQTVWISGASSGIGKEMAFILATRKVTLILSSRRKEILQLVAQECRGLGAKDVRILPLDLNDSTAALQAKAEKVGKVDVLINNGGVSTRVLAEESSVQVDEYLTQVDYLAHVAITKTLMKSSSPPSRIINIGSVASKVGLPVRTAYCGAKHALLGYMDALRIECLLSGKETLILNALLGSVRTNLALNAVVGTDSKGKMESMGQPDANIENGLDVTFVSERILAVSDVGILPECWLAIPKELAVFYLNQYCPRTGMKLLSKAVAKQYAVTKKSKEE